MLRLVRILNALEQPEEELNGQEPYVFQSTVRVGDKLLIGVVASVGGEERREIVLRSHLVELHQRVVPISVLQN